MTESALNTGIRRARVEGGQKRRAGRAVFEEEQPPSTVSCSVHVGGIEGLTRSGNSDDAAHRTE